MAEWLGASVAFDPLTRTVTVRDETHHIISHIGATAATVDGVDTQLPLPVFIFEEITMVPLRFLAESAGATVEWHAATQEIILSVPEKTGQNPASSNSARDRAGTGRSCWPHPNQPGAARLVSYSTHLWGSLRSSTGEYRSQNKGDDRPAQEWR
ncbi:MAG: copper amine oxidase N-terminal domain-containing protein [Limnochordia bacterium]